MSFIANPFVVVLDANVLYPVRVRDILLSFAQHGLFRARFTEEILDEWTRSLIANKPHLESSVQAQRALVADLFAECMVEGHECFIEALRLPDPGDRHVLAAAIRCSAQLIVTENLRDFPDDALAAQGIEAIGADAFLVNTFELYPSDSLRVLREVRARYENPRMTPSKFLLDLVRSGLPKFANALRDDIEFI